MFGLRKLVIVAVAILTVGVMPAFMSDAVAKGGHGGGHGGHARAGHGRGHNHARGHNRSRNRNRHTHRPGHRHHRHHHRYGRHWYRPGYVGVGFDGGADFDGDVGVDGGSEVVIYQVFSRPSATRPWRLAGTFDNLDEAEEEADALRDEGLEAMVE